MSKLIERMAALSPRQRDLLEKQLIEKGLENPYSITEGINEKKILESKNELLAERQPIKEIDFSLFFFSGNGSTTEANKYDFLLNSAKFADQNGFSAVWTPERHFQEFGGLYPNPSVLSAALAAVTENIELRAGSVVLPLHHPIRFTEEWSVVDNLSKGRVSVAFATGWHPADFLLAANQDRSYYLERKEEMFKSIDKVQKLWEGEHVQFEDSDGVSYKIQTLPRPLQKQIPVWIATNGNTNTFQRAAKIGANILTGMPKGGTKELEKKISNYRRALDEYGFDSESKKVAVMLHTCLGRDDRVIKEKVKKPLKEYLKTFMKQHEYIHEDYEKLSSTDFDLIVSRAFEAYYQDSALLGTLDKCAGFVEKLIEIGVDEIACLIDFGVDQDTAMEGLHVLSELKNNFTNGGKKYEKFK
ncbi:MupA/Atu3671 family FMN-dependent luciferase-like monooxygenase [Cytobacillus purgationiresistens]|uniref:Natural product biosynthesis luciferase-like monooxygenase protein n=1 Tax=Cytobacillus purgationiresistens TaxID=863449 RepID=A0ABU0ANW4_9BACI|nr:MupA/Atu3671 family FMN-dependent luciferase-like monooxygenase [Cytobacillus purgationiresistens]MDQ0272983.1 natural product biosynthesis luciferase-like monooxygenase protein [Cytobacillus purgationiresistens]